VYVVCFATLVSMGSTPLFLIPSTLDLYAFSVQSVWKAWFRMGLRSRSVSYCAVLHWGIGRCRVAEYSWNDSRTKISEKFSKSISWIIIINNGYSRRSPRLFHEMHSFCSCINTSSSSQTQVEEGQHVYRHGAHRKNNTI